MKMKNKFIASLVILCSVFAHVVLAAQPTVEVLRPNSSDRLQPGTTFRIQWRTQGLGTNIDWSIGVYTNNVGLGSVNAPRVYDGEGHWHSDFTVPSDFPSRCDYTLNVNDDVSEANDDSDVFCVGVPVTFSDSEFNDAEWELVVLTHQAGGTTTAGRSGAGGCPDAYRTVTNMVRSATPGTQSALIGFHRKIGATYSPRAQGAFDFIDYSECAAVSVAPFADGQATGPALRQGGEVYVYYRLTGPSGAWHSIGASNIWATDFFLVSSVSPIQWYDPDQHPDFSTNGGPIEFGFWRGNFTCPGCPGYTTVGGIDNWSITLRSALLMTIRCSEVEVCWNARPNRQYQVQYRSELTTNEWMDLVGPVMTNCVRDAIKTQERRFYRVIEFP
jgi:hypothetical protein